MCQSQEHKSNMDGKGVGCQHIPVQPNLDPFFDEAKECLFFLFIFGGDP